MDFISALIYVVGEEGLENLFMMPKVQLNIIT